MGHFECLRRRESKIWDTQRRHWASRDELLEEGEPDNRDSGDGCDDGGGGDGRCCERSEGEEKGRGNH